MERREARLRWLYRWEKQTGGSSSNDITASGIEPPKTCDNTTGYTVNTDPNSEESSFSFKDWKLKTWNALQRRLLTKNPVLHVFLMNRSFLFPVLCRWGISQLSPHVPIWLCNQRVWLQVEPYHLFHRLHVFLGPGQRPQEGVPWASPGPDTAHRRPQWLRSLNCGQLRGKTTDKKNFHSPLTAIHFSFSED